jgi:hypothetical protein
VLLVVLGLVLGTRPAAAQSFSSTSANTSGSRGNSDSNSVCWEANYGAPATRNIASQYKDKAD